jgi:hypothetical protein
MLTLSSTSAATSAVRASRTVSMTAYTLGHGDLFDALEDAARGGASVEVCLEGAPYKDAKGGLARANASIVAELRRAGVDARLSGPGDALLHAKTLNVDGALYLDDRNWRAGDLVLRDDDPQDPALATHKSGALTAEGALVRAADSGGDVILESESFGCCNAVYSALDDAAKRGLAPRVLVCARELHGNDRELQMLQRLASDGARVRVTNQTDKIALAGETAWLGSANATAAIPPSDTLDWGTCSDDAAIVTAVRERVESNWARAKPLVP